MREMMKEVAKTAGATTTTEAVWAWLKLNGHEPAASYVDTTAEERGQMLDQFTGRYPHHLITTSIGRLAVRELLTELDGRPFSCGRDADGDLRCDDEYPRCCVLSFVRRRVAQAQALLGLYHAVLPKGTNDRRVIAEGRADDLMRAWGDLHAFLESLNNAAFELDEGLSGFECDHVVEVAG